MPENVKSLECTSRFNVAAKGSALAKEIGVKMARAVTSRTVTLAQPLFHL